MGDLAHHVLDSTPDRLHEVAVQTRARREPRCNAWLRLWPTIFIEIWICWTSVPGGFHERGFSEAGNLGRLHSHRPR